MVGTKVVWTLWHLLRLVLLFFALAVSEEAWLLLGVRVALGLVVASVTGLCDLFVRILLLLSGWSGLDCSKKSQKSEKR